MTRDADEIIRDYGPEALRNTGGQVVEEPDGVATLAAVVDEVEAAPADGAQVDRLGPLIKLYGDRGRWAAVLAASVSRAAEVEGEILRLGAVLTSRAADQLRTRLRQDRQAQVRSTLRLVGGDDEEGPEIRACVDWPRYPEDVRLPAGWRLDRGRLRKVRAVRGQIVEEDVGRPVLVTRRLRDADDQSWAVELAWTNGARWETAIVPRSVALSSRELLTLADQGAPVSSATSARAVEWLTLLDQDEALPVDWCAARMGWVGSTAAYFLLGEQQIHAGEAPAHRVSLAASSSGARQAARAVRTGGTWEGWLQVCDVIHDQAAPWAIIYAACSAALLQVLDAPCYGIDMCGESGSGKSTLLELATSTCAVPRKGHGYAGWDGTLAGTEGSVGVRCDLPLCLDEGQLVPERRWGEAGTLLYAITSGAGRSKGQVGRLGMAHVDSWRTVLISTSEEGITSWSPHDGVRRRIIELRGAGLRTAEDTDRIREIIREHYGHLYQRFVQHVVDSAADRDDMRQAYAERRDQLRQGVTDSISRSAAAYVALVEVAAAIIHEALGVPRPSCDVAGWLWGQIRGVTSESDRAERAWDLVWSWCWARRADFAGPGAPERPASGRDGWLGVWLDHSGYVAVRPDRLAEVFSRNGLGSPASIYRSWAARGWLETEGGRTSRKVTVPGDGSLGGGQRLRMICLRIKRGE